MARQEVKVESAINLTKYPDKTLEGYYLGSKLVSGRFNNEQLIHSIEKLDGKKVSVYGFTSLNIHLEQVEIGTHVWITYLGKSTEKNKYGNAVHVCKVEYDFEDKKDVPRPEGTNESEHPDNDLPF